jgi:hypothetical protein
MNRLRQSLNSGLCSIALCFSGVAQALDYYGHAKYSFNHTRYPDHALQSLAGIGQQSLNAFNLRLAINHDWQQYSFDAHYELNALHSNQPNLSQPDDIDVNRWFDLSRDIDNDPNDYSYQRLDRLTLAYSSDKLVMRIGRQAVSWGNGLVFHPMDIFNPFQPVVIDSDYKTGDDMLYVQWLADLSHDWQLIFLPRRDDLGQLDDDLNSLALKYHGLLAIGDLDILLARHYNDELMGIGFARALGEAIWRLDVTLSHLDKGGSVTSIVTNMDYSWVWLNHNVYGYVEYYHNGFGEEVFTLTPNTDLQDRLDRAELFVSGKDYLSLGLQIELHPLLQLAPSLIVNLDDHSRQLPVMLMYDWQQNLSLKATLILSSGQSDAEFSGPLTTGDSFNLLMSYYF